MQFEGQVFLFAGNEVVDRSWNIAITTVDGINQCEALLDELVCL